MRGNSSGALKEKQRWCSRRHKRLESPSGCQPLPRSRRARSEADRIGKPCVITGATGAAVVVGFFFVMKEKTVTIAARQGGAVAPA